MPSADEELASSIGPSGRDSGRSLEADRDGPDRARRDARSVGLRDVGRPAELRADASRKCADDEIVGVLDEVADELLGEAAIQRDRVPVAFVEVVAGRDRGIAVSQLMLVIGRPARRRPVPDRA